MSTPPLQWKAARVDSFARYGGASSTTPSRPSIYLTSLRRTLEDSERPGGQAPPSQCLIPPPPLTRPQPSCLGHNLDGINRGSAFGDGPFSLGTSRHHLSSKLHSHPRFWLPYSLREGTAQSDGRPESDTTKVVPRCLAIALSEPATMVNRGGLATGSLARRRTHRLNQAGCPTLAWFFPQMVIVQTLRGSAYLAGAGQGAPAGVAADATTASRTSKT